MLNRSVDASRPIPFAPIPSIDGNRCFGNAGRVFSDFLDTALADLPFLTVHKPVMSPALSRILVLRARSAR